MSLFTLATSSILNKAMIEVLDGKGNVTDVIPVLFNPTDYSLAKSNEFANINIPGLESPLMQFVRGGQGSLTMELFFDSYEKNMDVRIFTKKITDLLKIDKELHAPPVVRFVWASLYFAAVLSQVTQKFTLFNSWGMPVRAKLNVTFKEYRTKLDAAARVLNSRDRTKVYTLKQGDSLWLLAYNEYGDVSQWRAIALENGIDKPWELEPGRKIVIPPLE